MIPKFGDRENYIYTEEYGPNRCTKKKLVSFNLISLIFVANRTICGVIPIS
jgi:ribosome biogenesis protein Tsr3